MQRAEDGNTTSYTWDSNVLHAIGESGELTNNNERQYLQDELGSPIRLFAMSGELEEVYIYDEFGQEMQVGQAQRSSGDIMQPFTYTGYQKDEMANTYFAQVFMLYLYNELDR